MEFHLSSRHAQQQARDSGRGESGNTEIDLRVHCAVGENLANIHRDSTGAERDECTIPAAVIEFTETGAGKAYHCHHEPARVAQGLDLREAFGDIARIQQFVLCHDDDVLNFCDDVHVDAAIGIFTRRGNTLPVFNRR